ncbi:MAG: SpoIIE family protein phosphatase, partial [bacterium]|nr:SpoIIE family protein phosphatase [bacterium]
SIGGMQREMKRVFTDQRLEVKTGDMLYLTSDGYSDQSDPHDRKIGTKRLMASLQEIARYPPDKQKNILLEELEMHRQGEAQRDDITIFGVKV